MSHLPSEEYIKKVEQEVERFERKGLHDTCWHEELAAIRKMQKAGKISQKEIIEDGEQD